MIYLSRSQGHGRCFQFFALSNDVIINFTWLWCLYFKHFCFTHVELMGHGGHVFNNKVSIVFKIRFVVIVPSFHIYWQFINLLVTLHPYQFCYCRAVK